MLDLSSPAQIPISQFGSSKIYNVDDDGLVYASESIEQTTFSGPIVSVHTQDSYGEYLITQESCNVSKGTNIPGLEHINDFLNEFDDMPPEQEDDNKGEEHNMEEEDSMEEENSMEEEEREIKDFKRKRVSEGDSELEDLFCEAEEEEEEGFVEPTPLEKFPIRRGPTTRSHCSLEDILEEDYVPLSDDGTDEKLIQMIKLCCTAPHLAGSQGQRRRAEYGMMRKMKKTFCIRKLQLEHTCAPSGENCKIPARYVAKVVEDSFRTDPRARIDTVIHKTKENFGVEVGKMKAYRRRQQALGVVQGRDGNNNIYPLAFGVVKKEDTPSWCWFLTQLKIDIGGESGQFGYYTIISNRQKGLLNAIDQIFPNYPQRFCLRHIYANFQSVGFKGDDLKKYMDAAAYSYTKNGFD
ncbi:MATE efflux family protein 3, chloroplastic [Hordeum vulgare]|nr:MATE efflux family protein 3, chloroplastic [Hordeum vulgare]